MEACSHIEYNTGCPIKRTDGAAWQRWFRLYAIFIYDFSKFYCYPTIELSHCISWTSWLVFRLPWRTSTMTLPIALPCWRITWAMGLRRWVWGNGRFDRKKGVKPVSCFWVKRNLRAPYVKKRFFLSSHLGMFLWWISFNLCVRNRASKTKEGLTSLDK